MLQRSRSARRSVRLVASWRVGQVTLRSSPDRLTEITLDAIGLSAFELLLSFVLGHVGLLQPFIGDQLLRRHFELLIICYGQNAAS